MNLKVVEENARTLAAALGYSSQEAAKLLDVTVLLTYRETDSIGRKFADFLTLLLTRTVSNVTPHHDSSMRYAVEVIIGDAQPRTELPSIRVSILADKIVISGAISNLAASANVHPALLLLGACYAAALVTKEIVGDALPIPHSDPLIIDFKQVLGADFRFDSSFHLEATYLAGAGAVGNGFLLALSLFNVQGELHIADSDLIDDGNLNRCVWFTETEINCNKAQALAALAQPFFPHLKLIPHPCILQKVPPNTSGAWLNRLIVGVDSRRARRNLQSEIPGEVYDASTTDIREIVLHFNHQPLNGLACLSCIYFQESGEEAHEKHIAEVLGVELLDVRSHWVSEDAAKRICRRYPDLEPAKIQSLAYDSLFKQLCGEGKLHTVEDRQVLAPFSFVSVLAGVYLAIELLRRLQVQDPLSEFNYWRASPWANPVMNLRAMRPSKADCEFCGNSILVRTANQLWRSTNDLG